MIRSYGNTKGSVFDAAWPATDVAAEQGRKPQMGDIRQLSDGRCYILCSTEADFVAGEIVAMAEFSSTELSGAITAAAIGATELTINTKSTAMFGGSAGVIAANRLVDGYIYMTDDTGEGYVYRIVSNEAGTATTSLVVVIDDGLHVAVDTSTDCIITGPRFRYVVEGSASLCPIGSAIVPTTASSESREEMFWVQFRGPACCLGAVTAGVPTATAASGAVADSAEAGSGGYDHVIGYGIGTTSDGNAAVMLSVPGMPLTK